MEPLEVDVNELFDLATVDPDLGNDLINYTRVRSSFVEDKPKYELLWAKILSVVKEKIDRLVFLGLNSNDEEVKKVNLMVTFTVNVLQRSLKYYHRNDSNKNKKVASRVCGSGRQYLTYLNNAVVGPVGSDLFDRSVRNSLAEICLYLFVDENQNHAVIDRTTHFAGSLLHYYLSEMLNSAGIGSNSGGKQKLLSESKLAKLTKLASFFNSNPIPIEEDHDRLQEVIIALFDSAKRCLLNCEVGIEFLARLLSLNELVLIGVRDQYLRMLEKTNACSNYIEKYAEVVYQCWNGSEQSKKKSIEQYFLLHFMKVGFTCDDPKTRSNLFKLLFYWHGLRTEKFARVLGHLYDSSIYVYLRSHRPQFRLNALEILMNAYPLEKPRSSLHVYSANLLKQHAEMLRLLTDDYPAIRLVCVRKICKLMKYFSNTFQNGTAERVVNCLTNELVDDARPDVSQAALKGLTLLLDNEEYYPMLRNALPTVQRCFHYEHAGVRKAFLCLLLQLRDKPSLGVSCKELIDIRVLCNRLPLESAANSKLIMELVYGTFYRDLNDSVVGSCQRLVTFLHRNPAPAAELGKYSRLPFEKAFEIICFLFALIRSGIKKSMEGKTSALEDDSDSDKENSKAPAETENERGLARLESEVIDECTLCAVLNYTCAVWTKHGKELNKPERNKERKDIYKKATRVVLLLLPRYKGTRMLYALINIAMLLPLSKLNSTTITGICISFLKSVDEPTDQTIEEMNIITRALLKWNRAENIFDMISGWIDTAMRVAKLDDSTVYGGAKRVKFDMPGGNASSVSAIFESIVLTSRDRDLLYIRNKQAILDFYRYLSRIRVPIGKRMVTHARLEPVTDEFLNGLFEIYLKLPVCFYLYRYDEFTDIDGVTDELINWIEANIVRNISGVDENCPPFEISLIRTVWKLVANVTACTFPKSCTLQWLKLALAASKRLDASLTVYLVDYMMVSAYHVSANIDIERLEATSDESDQTADLLNCIPEIVRIVCDSLSCRLFHVNDLSVRYGVNVNRLKRNLHELCCQLVALRQLHRDSTYRTVLRTLCQALLRIFRESIMETRIVPVTKKVSDLPFLVADLTELLFFKKRLAYHTMMALSSVIIDGAENGNLSFVAVLSLLYTFSCNRAAIDDKLFDATIKCVREAFAQKILRTNDVGTFSLKRIDNNVRSGSAHNMSLNSSQIICTPQHWNVSKTLSCLLNLIVDNNNPV